MNDRHRRRVESGGIEPLEADAIGLVFVLAGEIDLRLHRECLGRRDARRQPGPDAPPAREAAMASAIAPSE